MAELKTQVNDGDVDAFLDSLADERRREDGKKLRDLFEKLTGEPAKMWGSAIIGFGSYHYKSTRSKQEGDWMAIGFSPRKANLTLYLTDSYEFADHKQALEKLGPHKTSKSCLYIKKLNDVDESVLGQLITKSFKAVNGRNILQ